MAVATESKLDRYVTDVLAGRVLVNKYVRLAVERHVRDLEVGADRGLRFNEEQADFAVDFVECLRHSKAEWRGQPFVLEPWQAFIVGSLFGWERWDAEDGEWRRRFATAFVSVGRKNGKSTLAAAIGHKLFVADGEGGSEVYTAATKRDQARIVHGEAKRMVKFSPSLRKLVRILRDNLSIEATDSKYEPLGADEDTTDGLNISAAIVDEVHAHKTRGLWDVLESATSSRRNPLLLGITTAGEAGVYDSIYWELRDYSIKVLEGVRPDDTWFGYIATLDEGDDWTDESVWIKANPNLGVSVKLHDLRRKCAKAKETPSAVSNFRRRHCNQETESLDPWIGTEPGGPWTECAGELWWPGGEGFDPERFRNQECAVGGDLSSLSDLTALVFAFQDAEGFVDVVPFCWCPRDNALGRTRDKRVPYVPWADSGQLFLTEGDSVDYNALRELLRKARDEWGWVIGRIAFDPNNARQLVTQLREEDGFNGKTADDEEQVFDHQQTTHFMNEPIGVTEKLILDKKLRHHGHEPLRWCVSNVKVYTDTGGRRRFDKKKSSEKIDLAVAMVMGVSERLKLKPPPVSPYKTRGFLTV